MYVCMYVCRNRRTVCMYVNLQDSTVCTGTSATSYRLAMYVCISTEEQLILKHIAKLLTGKCQCM